MIVLRACCIRLVITFSCSRNESAYRVSKISNILEYLEKIILLEGTKLSKTKKVIPKQKIKRASKCCHNEMKKVFDL